MACRAERTETVHNPGWRLPRGGSCVSEGVTYVGPGFFAANHRSALSGAGVKPFVGREAACSTLMNSKLLAGAVKVVPLTELLVNVVSRRVRQLSLGHRPLVATPPGMGLADVALTEIIAGKLTSEPVLALEESEAEIITFPGTIAGKKKAA